MTFAEYWQKNEPCYRAMREDRKDVAELAWNAAIEQCAKIAYSYRDAKGIPGSLARMIDNQIRAGATKPLTRHATAQEGR